MALIQFHFQYVLEDLYTDVYDQFYMETCRVNV